MPKVNLQIDNSKLRIRNNQLLDENQITYLTNPVSSGVTSIEVENITSAAVSGWMIIGEIGSEGTEISQIHTSTSPTGRTITLDSGLTFSHPSDCPIYFINYNQVEFSRATTSGGSKSVLSTVTITPDGEFTQYQDTNSTGYAYARFKNSTTSSYTDYSDEQVYSSQTFNSVGKIIDSVFRSANETKEVAITRKEVLEDFIWGFLNKVSELRTRWNHEETATNTSNTTTLGGEAFTLPSDIKFADRKGIQGIALEGHLPLTYISLMEWMTKIEGLARSTLNGAVLAGATTIDLMNGTNFAESGTGYIGGDTFTWTGKTDNQLTGVSGILAHDSGSVVYQSDACGMPEYYTIHNGVGYLFYAPSADYDGLPVMINYYKDVTRPDSENDLLPVKYIEACKDYCNMRIAQKAEKWAAYDRLEKATTAGILQAIKNERISSNSFVSTRKYLK